MSRPILITDIHFTAATRSQRALGLWGFASCRLDGRWQIDGLKVCKTTDGRYVLSFPARTDGIGREHAYFRPLDDDTRCAIEAQVIGHLRAMGFVE